MSSKSPTAMLFPPVYLLDHIPPIRRAFFLAEVLRDGIVDLFNNIMYLLEHHSLSLHHFLASHSSCLSLTLTHTEDEANHLASPRNTFALFQLLPTELRQLIWSFALEPSSGRLFHIEALRRADFGRTEAQWAFYQRRGRPGGMTMAMCPDQRIPYIAASCKEAYEVVRRHSYRQGQAKLPQEISATSPTLDDRGCVRSTESFRPESDILYVDALCLGCLPSPHVARNRIRTFASPRQGREVETIALEAGSLWSSAIGTNDSSIKPTVRKEALRAICEEFSGVKRLVLLGSRQCEQRESTGLWGRLLGGARRRKNGEGPGQVLCENERDAHDGKAAVSAAELNKIKSSVECRGLTSGAGTHLAFHPAVQGVARLFVWALGDDGESSSIESRERLTRERRIRRNRKFIHQVATEKECCKTLPVCLLDVEDFEEVPDCGVNDDMESGHGVDEVEAARTMLEQLLADGDITQLPIVERKIIVRSAGCTGPWSYRTGMARESCSNDDWYWQRRRMKQPVWRIANDGKRLEFS